MEVKTHKRYYRNLRTGQYCLLEGSIIAIKRVLTSEWRKKKVLAKRITRAEFWRNVPAAMLGHEYNYHPNYSRKGRSEIRKGNTNQVVKFAITYYPY